MSGTRFVNTLASRRYANLSNAERVKTVEAKRKAEKEDLESAELVADFWSLERIGIEHENEEEKKYSTLELIALRLMQQLTYYNEQEKRFYTGLLFNPEIPHEELLDSNEKRATAVLKSMLRRVDRLGVRQDVDKIYHEMFANGYGEIVPVEEIEVPRSHILNSHIVYCPDRSTKCRLVLDASAPCASGYSLNNCLLPGPCLYPELLEILLAWRSKPVAVITDVKKCFWQTRMRQEFVDWQRAICHFEGDELPTLIRFLVVIFGINSSPMQSCYVIKRMAEMWGQQFPKAAEAVKSSCYVDDLVNGAANPEEARQLVQELIQLFAQGSMSLSKFQSNCPEALQDLDESQRLPPGEACKVLGTLWDPALDNIYFNFVLVSEKHSTKLKGGVPMPSGFSKPETAEDFFEELDDLEENEDTDYGQKAESAKAFIEKLEAIPDERVTKRCISSSVSAIFDVFGILGPYVLTGKLILREVWESQLGWDDPVSTEITQKWRSWLSQLSRLQNVALQRTCFLPDAIEKRIVLFCDASKEAMGAVAYAVSENRSGEVMSTILAAKSKVMPLKAPLTIPRAELAACEIGSRLAKKCAKSLEVGESKIIAFTDSATALHWLWHIKEEKRRVWVERRVKQVAENLPLTTWRHCCSQENPADLMSRGIMDLKELGEFWQCGPQWLREDPDEWVRPGDISALSTEERQGVERADEREILPKRAQVNFVIRKGLSETEKTIFERYESWTKVINLTAYVRRFITRLRNKREARIRGLKSPYQRLPTDPGDQIVCKLLKVEERREAIRYWIRRSQEIHLGKEVEELTAGEAVSADSIIAAHNPFFDQQEKLIKANTRLVELELDEGRIRPVLLPKRSPIVEKFLLQLHLNNMHAPVETLLRRIFRDYILVGKRRELRRILHLCPEKRPGRCRRTRAFEQVMAPLPRDRGLFRPWDAVGIDCFGPFYLGDRRKKKGGKEKKKPGEPKEKEPKAWGLVICCMSTRAVVVKILRDMTSFEFINAFREFVNERGVPRVIYSDLGTNFVAAKGNLRKLQRPLTDRTFWEETIKKASETWDIDWKFNYPFSPHMGGSWESLVKLVKRALVSVLGRSQVDLHELRRLFTDAQALVNSRPLAPMSDDDDDPAVITPFELVNGRPFQQLEDLAQGKSYDHPNMTKVWRYRTRLLNRFWEKWRDQYLMRLAARSKWTQERLPPEIGQIVVINDPTKAKGRWKWGRIVQLKLGRDGKPRGAVIRTPAGTLLARSIHRLSVMEDEYLKSETEFADRAVAPLEPDFELAPDQPADGEQAVGGEPELE